MFQRIQQYPLIEANGRFYRPRAYADPQPDGTWDGWLVFFSLLGGRAIAPPGPETTVTTLAHVIAWAAGITPIVVEEALARAFGVAVPAPLIERLTSAEYEALEDAERLKTAAERARTVADVDEAAADAAQSDAERLRTQRLGAQAALAEREEAAANVEASLHEEAAREARAVAAHAKRRRRSSGAAGMPKQSGPSPGQKK